jgi:hypothetical protein
VAGAYMLTRDENQFFKLLMGKDGADIRVCKRLSFNLFFVKILKNNFFKIIFLVFLYRFDMLISKINLKKVYILMYFQAKSILKRNYITFSNTLLVKLLR